MDVALHSCQSQEYAEPWPYVCDRDIRDEEGKKSIGAQEQWLNKECRNLRNPIHVAISGLEAMYLKEP